MLIILHVYLRYMFVYTNYRGITTFRWHSCVHKHWRCMSVFTHTSGAMLRSYTSQVHDCVLVHLRCHSLFLHTSGDTLLCSYTSQRVICALYDICLHLMWRIQHLTLTTFSKEGSRGLGDIRATKKQWLSTQHVQQKMLSFSHCYCTTFSQQDLEHWTFLTQDIHFQSLALMILAAWATGTIHNSVCTGCLHRLLGFCFNLGGLAESKKIIYFFRFFI